MDNETNHVKKSTLDWSMLKNTLSDVRISNTKHLIINLEHRVTCQKAGMKMRADTFEMWIKEGVLTALQKNLVPYHISCSASKMGEMGQEKEQNILLEVATSHETPKTFDLSLIGDSLEGLWSSMAYYLNSSSIINMDTLLSFSQKFTDTYWLEKKISFKIERDNDNLDDSGGHQSKLKI